MNAVNVELSEEKRRHRAFYDMVKGASDELGIEISELAGILKIYPQRVYDWKKIGIPFNNQNHLLEISVNDYISLYNKLASFYVSISDAKSWLREPSSAFNNNSPVEYMINEPHGLKEVVDYLSHRMNP